MRRLGRRPSRWTRGAGRLFLLAPVPLLACNGDDDIAITETVFSTFSASGTTVTFVDQSDATPTSWQWDFGGHGASSLRNPTFAFPGGAWQHATLAAGGHAVPPGAVVDVPGDRLGAFVYRSSSGYGTFSASGLGLAWDHAADGVAAAASVEVRPFGIEMVYVPQGSFSLGSGGTSYGEFREGGTTNAPFVVTGQSVIDLGDAPGQLMWTEDDFYHSGSAVGSTNAAFTDWAALRPMTELEFEKAARGPLTPVPNEFAWGNTSLTQATGLADGGTAIETPTPADANANYSMGGNPIGGPVRAGSFALPGDSRRSAGAGYYGALELSGNLWAWAVSVGHPLSRTWFEGEHGDGALTPSGTANVASWPDDGSFGAGLRGGHIAASANYLRVSDRYNAALAFTFRPYYGGSRGARSAP